MKLGRMETLVVVVLAALLTSAVASQFPPLTDAARALLILTETENLPQNR